MLVGIGEISKRLDIKFINTRATCCLSRFCPVVKKVCTALANFQRDPGVLYMGCGAVGNLSHSNPQVRVLGRFNGRFKRVGLGRECPSR